MHFDHDRMVEAFLLEHVVLELGTIRQALSEAVTGWPAAAETDALRVDRITARLAALEEEARRLCIGVRTHTAASSRAVARVPAGIGDAPAVPDGVATAAAAGPGRQGPVVEPAPATASPAFRSERVLRRAPQPDPASAAAVAPTGVDSDRLAIPSASEDPGAAAPRMATAPRPTLRGSAPAMRQTPASEAITVDEAQLLARLVAMTCAETSADAPPATSATRGSAASGSAVAEDRPAAPDEPPDAPRPPAVRSETLRPLILRNSL